MIRIHFSKIITFSTTTLSKCSIMSTFFECFFNWTLTKTHLYSKPITTKQQNKKLAAFNWIEHAFVIRMFEWYSKLNVKTNFNWQPWRSRKLNYLISTLNHYHYSRLSTRGVGKGRTSFVHHGLGWRCKAFS